jgi:hypothetical protein
MFASNINIIPNFYNIAYPRKAGYGYSQQLNVIVSYGDSQEPGYKYEAVKLAFENHSQSIYLDDTPIPTAGSFVET